MIVIETFIRLILRLVLIWCDAIDWVAEIVVDEIEKRYG